MPLNPAKLSGALIPIFQAFPASKEEAARQIADAYRNYCGDGLFGASVPVLTDIMRDAMATTLAIGLTVPGLPPTIAGAFAASVSTFWIAVPVVGAQSGVTNGCPGAGAIAGALTAAFANLANTPQTIALAIAAAMHSATLTVTANVAPPPGTVAPFL